MSLLSDVLKRLLDCEQPLNASAFTANQRSQLEQFARNTRLIEVVKQGRATVYRVLNRQGVLNALLLQQPLVETDVALDLPARSRNIGLDRNSKKGQPILHSCNYLLIKAWEGGVVWQANDSVVHPAELTMTLGVMALQIRAGQSWGCNRSILLVENQALFDRTDWLPEAFDGCLVYYAGQLSELLLQWLGEQKRCELVVLFPDYDGIGLTNYTRLAEALHPDTPLQFYWLAHWKAKVPQFGNAELWRKTRVQFDNALAKLQTLQLLDDDFMALGQLLQHHGKALEQEAIWL